MARVGVRAGPFYASTSTRGGGNGCGFFLGMIAVLAAIGFTIEYWYVAIPVVLLVLVGIGLWVAADMRKN